MWGVLQPDRSMLEHRTWHGRFSADQVEICIKETQAASNFLADTALLPETFISAMHDRQFLAHTCVLNKLMGHYNEKLGFEHAHFSTSLP